MECSICLGEETGGGEGCAWAWTERACGHAFHRKCIMRWGRQRACPLCRATEEAGETPCAVAARLRREEETALVAGARRQALRGPQHHARAQQARAAATAESARRLAEEAWRLTEFTATTYARREAARKRQAQEDLDHERRVRLAARVDRAARSR